MNHKVFNLKYERFNMRTLFVEAYIKEDLTPLLAEIIKKVKAQKIGLVTTVQHIKGLDFV